jgi:hypothetical protein
MKHDTWSDDNKVHKLATVCLPWQQRQPQFGLMTLAYQGFTAVLLLIYGSLFVSGVYYCLSVSECFGVPLRECRSFLLNLAREEAEKQRDASASLQR